MRLKYAVMGLLICYQSAVTPLFAVAPVLDFTDLPIEIKNLLEEIQQVKTAIDQLIAMYNELEHWKEQAQKLTGRDGFRLRDIEAYYSENSMGYFYSGDSELQALAKAIDDGASATEIASRMKQVFPLAGKVSDWQTGRFSIVNDLKDVMEKYQKAQGLGYGGVAETLAMVGQARKNYEENKDTYDYTRDQWEEAEGGEQEALDLIHVQLSQLVDLMTQEQALLTGLTSQEATTQNWALVQESESFKVQEDLMQHFSDAAASIPPVQDSILR